MTFFKKFCCASLVSLPLSALLVFTAGCGLGNGSAGTDAASSSSAHTGISGKIYGGQQPVAGALIQLYEVGTTGYTTGMAKPLITSTTVRTTSDGTGSFNISHDYTCDAGSYVYLTAAGGDSGNTGTTNSAIVLGAALGPCAQLSTSTYILVNEVTTVALAYSLAQFSLSSTFGTTLVAQPGSTSSAPADNFTTSSTNVQGIANAMAMAQILANFATGSSPGSNSNGSATAEYWQINTIANILFSCVNSTNTVNGGASAACSTLFANVNIPAGINPTTGLSYAAPADILQAAIYMALNPTLTTTQIAALYGLTTPNAPYTPYATTAANIRDLSVAVSFNPVYSGTQLLGQPTQVAFDSYGNVWVANHPTAATGDSGNPTGSLADYVVELDPVGNPIPTSSATPTSVSNYEITSYTVSGASTPTTLLGFNSATVFPFFSLAIDTDNNVWLTDKSNSNIVKIGGSGQVINASSSGPLTTYNGGSAAVGYALTASTFPFSLAIDGNNDVFIATTGGTVSNTCSTGNASSALSSSADKGLVTFVGGSNTNVNYGRLAGNPYAPILVDGGTAKFTSTSTLVPGQPFVWALGYGAGGTQSASLASGTNYPTTGVLWQNYGGTGGTNGQGCYTPLAYDGSSTTTSGIASTLDSLGNVGSYGTSFVLNTNTAATTQIPGTLGTNSANGTQVKIVPAITGASTTAAAAYLISSEYGIALDNSGVWISNTGYADSTSATAGSGAAALNIKYSVARFQPSYSAALTPTDAAANSSYTLFHDIGGMSASASVQPRLLAVDGGQNVWMQFVGASVSTVGAISYTTGAALSPAYASPNAGFAGSVCPTTCRFTGTTATYTRSNGVKQPAIDASGNVWLPQNGTTAYPKLTVIVGTAVPLSNPQSLAIKNGTFGMKP